MKKVSGFFKRLWDCYRKKLKIFLIAIGIIAAVVFTLICLAPYSSNLSKPYFSSKEFKKYQYLQVVEYLEGLGFKNIKTVPVKDLDQGGNGAQLVTEVSIGGETNYDEDSSYGLNTPIIIRYHTFSKDSIDFSKVSLTGSKEEVKQNLLKNGFKFVEFENNNITSGSSSDLSNCFVTIDGKKALTNYHYSKNAKVKINYNTLAPDAINIKDFKVPTDGNYNDVVDKFKQLGFTNVNTKGIETSLIYQNNNIDKVTIDGINQSTVISDQILKKNIPIMIYYKDASAEIAKKASENDPSIYGTVDYNSWNHDEVERGTKIQISGKVLQVSKGFSSVKIRVASDGAYDDIVMVTVDRSYYNSNILAEDDMITVYGTNSGLTSYTSVLGAEITLPSLYAVFYNRN